MIYFEYILTEFVGRNTYGQLGLGDKTDRGLLTSQMGNSLSVVDLGDFVPEIMGTGRYHTFVVSNDGKLRDWGYGDYGKLGYGNEYRIGDGSNEMGDLLPDVDLGSGVSVAGTSSNCCNHHSCVLVDYGAASLGLKWY